jgi:ABC-type dipeptide/oligopeptide/nickel transport system permease component
VWSILYYWLISKKENLTPPAKLTNSLRNVVIVPSLVLGALAISLSYKFFGINLIFPLHLFASTNDLILKSFVPALILVVASGLAQHLSYNIRQEYVVWHNKNFVLVSKSLGLNPSKTLRSIVLVKSITESWTQCLPWLFGELIVIECIFNAPGLGFDAWTMAKTRDFAGLFNACLWLTALYALCVLANYIINKWNGKKLESYM